MRNYDHICLEQALGSYRAETAPGVDLIFTKLAPAPPPFWVMSSGHIFIRWEIIWKKKHKFLHVEHTIGIWKSNPFLRPFNVTPGAAPPPPASSRDLGFLSKHHAKTLSRGVILLAVWQSTQEYWATLREKWEGNITINPSWTFVKETPYEANKTLYS